MNTFTEAVDRQITVTTNDMPAFVKTLDANVDLFYKIGASRGKDIRPDFVAAFVENPELALRIAQWARDVRGGAGERQLFRDIGLYLAKSNNKAAVIALMKNIPEVGRWDDVLFIGALSGSDLVKGQAFSMIQTALQAGDGLCAKWMPRKGALAAELRTFLQLSPKAYRKLLVSLTKVVETQMCANQWDKIEYGKVPSVASRRYMKAFQRHSPERFEKFVEKVAAGEDKINAGAVYPYDILKGINAYNMPTGSQRTFIVEQWKALPDFIGDYPVLPLVDVSGSMGSSVGSGITAMDVALSLGLYFADKNKGAFKDTFLTFSAQPELLHLKGDVLQKMEQMSKSKWAMNTNVSAAFAKILRTAIEGKVAQEDMPKMLMIFSDMQFDQCTEVPNARALEVVAGLYRAAGYELPLVVFWNINAHANAPARFNEDGVGLVSGFSPSIAKTLLSPGIKDFNPQSLMLKAVMIDRYALDATF